MSGYTPVFQSIYSGSLFGQWPAAAVMASILPLCDSQGRIDLHPKAIAAMTGWPQALLEQGLAQLMEPDHDSRTQAADGRRLIPLDPERPWGWLVVNFTAYREKARLMAKSAREVASGANKQRMTAGDRRRPPETASQTQTQTQTQTSKKEEPAPPGLDREAWGIWVAYRSEIKKPIRPCSVAAAQRRMAAMGKDQMAAVENSIANSWQGLFPPKEPDNGSRRATPRKSAVEQVRDATGCDLRTIVGASPPRVVGTG